MPFSWLEMDIWQLVRPQAPSYTQSRALFIEEVLRVILEHVPDEPFREAQATSEHIPPMDTEASSTLARMARVCKAFSGPALDVLWRDLYDIEHLLRLLSGFRMKSERREEQYFSLYGDLSTHEWALGQSLYGTVPGHEWACFTTYAKRVRRFEYSRRNFEVTLFKRLAELCKGRPLLPSLQELRWRTTLEYLSPEVLLFITPGLRHLTLCGNWRHLSVEYPLDPRARSSELARTVIGKLADIAPNLEVLNIPLLPPDGAAWDPLARFQKLNTVCLNDISWIWEPPLVLPSLRALATIPCLRSLDLQAGYYNLVGESTSLLFASLEFLKLRMHRNRAWMWELFSILSAPRLRSLSVVSENLEPNTSRVLLKGIRKLRFTESLREVHLRHTTMNGDGTMLETLQPLLQMPQLTAVSLHMFYIPTGPISRFLQTITNADMAAVASAWPRLQALSITTVNLWLMSELPSLGCLHAFAQFCPDLRSLALPVTPALPVVEHAPEPAALHIHPLEKLTLQLFRYDHDAQLKFVPAPSEVESIARTVHQIFPSLNLAMCLSPLCGELGDTRWDTDWDCVVEAIALLQDSRGHSCHSVGVSNDVSHHVREEDNPHADEEWMP